MRVNGRCIYVMYCNGGDRGGCREAAESSAPVVSRRPVANIRQKGCSFQYREQRKDIVLQIAVGFVLETPARNPCLNPAVRTFLHRTLSIWLPASRNSVLHHDKLFSEKVFKACIHVLLCDILASGDVLLEAGVQLVVSKHCVHPLTRYKKQTIYSPQLLVTDTQIIAIYSSVRGLQKLCSSALSPFCHEIVDKRTRRLAKERWAKTGGITIVNQVEQETHNSKRW